MDRQQGYGDFEYEAVVIDDGSTDGTRDFIQGVNTNYEMKYFFLERTENSCRSLARNEGLRRADGKIAVYIDDDILVNSNYLKELERFYAYYENLAVIGTRIELPPIADDADVPDWEDTVWEAYKKADSKYLEIRYQTLNSLSYNLSAHRLPWALVFSCNLAVPTATLRELGGFDEEFKGWGYEDIELGYRLYEAGVKIVVNSKLEVMHQGHPKSRMQKNNIELFKQKCLNRMEDMALRSGAQVLTQGGVFRPSFNNKFKSVRDNIVRQEVIDFRSRDQLDDVKQKILELIQQSGLEIIVNDYVEDAELDIWVQLQKQEKSLLLYYPKSKPAKLNCFSFIDDIMMRGYSEKT